MTRQWKRACKLTIEGDSKAIDLSELRIKFAIRQGDVRTPSVADIRVYNLSEKTAQAIKKEFRKVTLEGGYEENSALLFTGEVRQVRTGRENPVDTYLDILATNADRAFNFGVVNKTLAAGHTFKDQVEVAFQAMKPFDVTMGFIADLGPVKMPRARVLFGMARDVLTRVGFSTNTSWSIQNGKLQMVKNSGFMPGDVVVLNSRTGMIGRPVQTIEGIIVRCLINPEIRVTRRVKIDQASIQVAPLNVSDQGAPLNAEPNLPKLADDGIYKVLFIEIEGDTRGQPWYMDLICIRADGTLPASQVGRWVSPNGSS